MRARVIVTKKCNRKCKGCCNERLGLIDKVSFEDLFKYEEICITEGLKDLGFRQIRREKVTERCVKPEYQGYKYRVILEKDLQEAEE